MAAFAANSVFIFYTVVVAVIVLVIVPHNTGCKHNKTQGKHSISIIGVRQDIIYSIDSLASNSLFLNKIILKHVWNFILQEIAKAARTTHAATLFVTTGVYILLLNIVGILPYSYTITAQLVSVFIIASINFTFLVILALIIRKERIVLLVTPSGLGFSLLNFLVLIETVSFLSRLFSLALRLFANMTAGHALLKILIGFMWVLFGFLGLFMVFSIGPFLVVIAVQLLEFLIAFLQAYVFITLLLIYIGEVYSTVAH